MWHWDNWVGNSSNDNCEKKIIMSELSVHYGFPSSSHAEIVSSTSVYINEQPFSHWVTNVLVPSIGMRHHVLQLPEDTRALLILDGCYAHSKEILMALQEHHIAFHFLPPHSSHISTLRSFSTHGNWVWRVGLFQSTSPICPLS